MKTARTPEVVKKVKRLTQTDNPSTQQLIGRRLGASQRTVSRIIREDLDLKRLKKPLPLTDAMLEKRKKLAKAFRNKIGGELLKYVPRLDESILSNDHTNGETAHYYA